MSCLVSPTDPDPVTEKKPAGPPKEQKFNGTHQKKEAAEVAKSTKASTAVAPHLPAVALVPASAALASAALELVPSTPLAANSLVAAAFSLSPVPATGLAQESAKARRTASKPTSPTGTSVPCLSKRAQYICS